MVGQPLWSLQPSLQIVSNTLQVVLSRSAFDSLTLDCLFKDFPQCGDVSTRLLTDFDQISISFLDGYPEGLFNVFAILSLHDWPFRRPIYPFRIRRHYRDMNCWRAYANIFDLPLIPTPFILSHSILEFVAVCYLPESCEFLCRIFKDASRSLHHAIDKRQHNALTGRCLSFLIHHITGRRSRAFIRDPRLKTHPWLTKRRNMVRGRSIPHQIIQSQKGPHPQEGSTWPTPLLMYLRLALFYLPSLFRNATYSQELVA